MDKHKCTSGSYQFRYEDTGETVCVSFEEMMGMDTAGYLTIKGRVARRINRPTEKAKTEVESAGHTPLVSDALGFPIQQLGDFETDRMTHGFRSVEFRPDPLTPGFMQVHFANRQERDRYIKHRGMADYNSRNGSKAMLSPALMERTAKVILREKIGPE